MERKQFIDSEFLIIILMLFFTELERNNSIPSFIWKHQKNNAKGITVSVLKYHGATATIKQKEIEDLDINLPTDHSHWSFTKKLKPYKGEDNLFRNSA